MGNEQDNAKDSGARRVPVKKNDDVTLDIVATGSEGQGIGRCDGYAVMVPFALPGERVQAHIIKAGSRFAVGKLTQTLVAAPERVQPACPVFGKCGGCALQHMEYSAQLAQKQRQVEDALRRIGGFADVVAEPTVGMAHPWRYRNKAAFPVGEAQGRAVLGMYAANSHRLVPLEDCPIQCAADAPLLALIRRWIEETGIPPYAETTLKGTLRHIIVRRTSLGEVMVIVVTKGALRGQDKLVAMLRGAGVSSIVHNRNDEATNVIMGERSALIYGAERINEVIGGLRFGLSATSFLQVNHAQYEKIIDMMLEDAALQGNERVLDLYCGVGTLSLQLAKHARSVTGVEIVGDAVEDARRSAQANSISNAQFVFGDAGAALRAGDAGFDVVVLDPPRKGCEAEVLGRVTALRPSRIIYISCNPATLARDARLIADAGYAIARVRPLDMFPQTAHVETVVLLQRVEG